MTDPRPPFHLHEPGQIAGPVIFASPHSGRDAPEGLRARVRPQGLALRSSEDAFIGHMIQPLRRAGAPVLSARFARWVVDLNRSPDELDPALIADLSRPARPNARLLAGLGVIPRVVGGGRVLYHGKIRRDEAQARIDQIWHPYHAALGALIARSQARFGQAILIDVHSMPHDACAGLPGPAPQIVLGDRYGQSAAPWVTDLLALALSDEGFSLHRNSPFAGAYIAAHYGAPDRGVHVVQLELDRGLYMDEASLRPRPAYREIRARLTRALSRVAQIGQGLPLAAQ